MKSLTVQSAATDQQESAAVHASPDKRANCEVKVIIKLWRWQRIINACPRRAKWISLNMCCGSTTRACHFHYTVARKIEEARQQYPDGALLRCGECGQETTLEWSCLL